MRINKRLEQKENEKKAQSEKYSRDRSKLIRTIITCETKEHIKIAGNMLDNFDVMYRFNRPFPYYGDVGHLHIMYTDKRNEIICGRNCYYIEPAPYSVKISGIVKHEHKGSQ